MSFNEKPKTRVSVRPDIRPNQYPVQAYLRAQQMDKLNDFNNSTPSKTFLNIKKYLYLQWVKVG